MIFTPFLSAGVLLAASAPAGASGWSVAPPAEGLPQAVECAAVGIVSAYQSDHGQPTPGYQTADLAGMRKLWSMTAVTVLTAQGATQEAAKAQVVDRGMTLLDQWDAASPAQRKAKIDACVKALS